MNKHHCLDEELLAAYFDGLLSAAQEEHFHQELQTCSDCLQLAASLGVVIAAETEAWRTMPMPRGLTDSAIALWPEAAGESADVATAVAEGLRVAIRWVGQALEPLADALQPLQPAGIAVRGAAAKALPEDELRFQATLGDLPIEIDIEVDGIHEVALTVRPMYAPPAGLLLRVSNGGETRAISSFGRAGTTVSALPTGGYELSLEQANCSLGKLHLELHD